MSLSALAGRLPAYAKDIKLNLSNVAGSNLLDPTQLWGAMLAAALASRNQAVIAAVAEEAAQRLTPEAATAAKTAAAIMAMNNVYYRSVHLIADPEYRKMPARLRMTALANPGVDKVDFELWCLAVSAVNGCGLCLDAHARELAAKGVGREAVQEALRIAAVVHAAAAILDGESAIPLARAAA
jgi:alkyl hydroperoxide reductase subunit D